MRSTVVVILAAMAAIVCAFAPGLSGSFIFDDYPTILHEARIHLDRFSWDGLKTAAFAFHPEGGLPRPLANASFALNHLAAGGLDPFGFKLTNLALHLVNALLLGAWLRLLLLATGRPPDRATMAAAAIALLWAIHPLQVSTVFYVVQRMEMLWVTFALASLLAYSHGRLQQIRGESQGLGSLGLAAAAFILGFSAKESAALIPFFLVALECLVFRARAVDPRWAKAWRLGSTSGIVIGVLSIAGLFAKVLSNPMAYATRDFTLVGRLLAQLEIVPGYLGLILAPRVDRMTFYYDHLVAPSTADAGVIVGGGLLLALITAAAMLRHKRPLFALGSAIFLFGHLLTSGPLPLELAFEHRNYLPIAGVLLALYGLLPTSVGQIPLRQSIAALCIGVVGLGGLTAIRAATWSNPVVLAQSLVDMNPTSTRAAMDLGEQYMLAAARDPESPWYPKALAEFERASLLPQGSIMGEHGLLLLNADFGLEADPAWWARLERKLSSGTLRPQDLDALTGLVEQLAQGVPLDGRSLSRVTLIVARRRQLAPELLALYGQEAFKAAGPEGPAPELFSRALAAPGLDDAYRARLRRGIENLGGQTLLDEVDASRWTPSTD